MSPKYDISKLSDEALQRICDVGETGAGHWPFQKASSLRVLRKQNLPVYRDIVNKGLWVLDLDPSEISRLNRITGEEG